LSVEIQGFIKMKKNIHPKVRQVVFKDTSSDFSFLGTSTMDSKETIKWEDGKSYPLIKLEISSASHPFFTGKQRVSDSGGRIERFKRKYGKKWIVAGESPRQAVIRNKLASLLATEEIQP
jgi:large subunit ribosomal protein L31